MKVYIYQHRQPMFELDALPNQRQVITERIDVGVLDSQEFTFTSSYGENIPPYSIIEINGKFWFISSVCNKNMAFEGVYFHNATIIDPIKIFQCFILGTKAFSNVYDDSINEVPDYNTNYRRCMIILELINQQYADDSSIIKFTNYKLGLDYNTFQSLKQEREYSFGSGTTMYDALNEIVTTEGRILKGEIIKEGDYFNVVARAVDINSYNTRDFVEHELKNATSLSKEVNEDDYCFSVETEITDVVDRDQTQIWYGTPRSSEDVITMDNANLVIDSKIYYPKYLYTRMLSASCAVFRFERNYDTFPFDKTPTNGFYAFRDGTSILNVPTKIGYLSLWNITIKTFRDNYIPAALRGAFNNWANSVMTKRHDNWDPDFNWNYRSFYNPFVYFTPKYVYLLIAEADTNGESGDDVVNFPHMVCWNPLLEANEYNLIEARYKKFFLYYEHLGKTINGFLDDYTAFDDNWITKNIIQCLSQLNENQFVDIYKGEYFFCDFEEHPGNSKTYNGAKLPFGCVYNTNKNYPVVINARKLSEISATEFLATPFALKFVSCDSIKLRSYKSTLSDLPNNELSWKSLGRSYNNGGNNVDYHALLNDMVREVDALGRTYSNFESTEEYTLGSYIKKLGYITVKQTLAYPNGAYTFVYSCYPKLYTVPKNISVETQFETTNVPNTGVVERYIYTEEHLALIDKDVFFNPKSNPMLIIFGEGSNGYSNLGKYCNVYEDDEKLVAVAEMVDNYTFGYRQGVSSFGETIGGNLAMIPVPIQNNEFNGAFIKTLNFGYINVGVIPDSSQLQLLPLTNWGSYGAMPIIEFTKEIYKDPREKLIFVFRTIDWETE